MEKPLLHICQKNAWEEAQKQGEYRADSLQSEGFIHCSTIQQVVRTANLLFEGEGGLIILYIDPEKVKAEIKLENTEGGTENFPHIYGALNLDAVYKVVDFKPNVNGYFEMPPV